MLKLPIFARVQYLMSFDVYRSEVCPTVEDETGLGIMRRAIIPRPLRLSSRQLESSFGGKKLWNMRLR